MQEVQLLEERLSPWTEKYNTVYRPLRSKVFAHRVLKNDVDVQRLASVVQIPEMEALLLFVYNLALTLEEMYLNGADRYSPTCRSWIRRRLSKVLKRYC